MHGPGPDSWLRRGERACFLAVSAATPQDVQRQRQPDLFGGAAAPPVGEGAARRLADFTRALPASPAVPGALLFPNLTRQQLPAPSPEGSERWISKSRLSPGETAAWLETLLSKPLAPEQIEQIRAAFTPDVVVPAAFTVRRPPRRHTEAELAPYLLDYDQEHALKLDLNLPQAGRGAAQDFHLRLINGVAGSGKSLIILYRAHLLRRLYPDKQILVLSHNRALIRDLRRRYRRLSGGDRAAQLYTFMGWCRRYWPREKPWRHIIRHRERLDLVTRVWHAHLSDTAVSAQMLLEEIDWYKDRLLFGRDDYLAVDRTGRGFPLTPSMRHRFYDAMRAYHQALQADNLMDWGDVPRQMWRFLENNAVALPRYDVILVDEAQFFAPLWFEIIKRVLRPETGHLFLVADASQGFLKRGQSWLASGLEVRGRTHRLTKSYRTTRAILDFATLLYRTRLPDDEEDIVAPDLMHMPAGVAPVLIPLTSKQDETTRVINEIRQLVENGVPRRHILVIHANRDETQATLARLNRTFGPDAAADPARVTPGDQIRVCSLNAAAGLESPIVFLMGVHDLYEEEQSVRLSPEEQTELIRDNTRKLYMAITRAGQRLVITYVGPPPEILRPGGKVSRLRR